MKAYRDDQQLLNFRINVVMWLVAGAFLGLGFSFWFVQGANAEKFRGLSESNRLREIVVPAKRGLITDRDGKIFVDNQPAYTLTVIGSDLRDAEKELPGYRDQLVEFLASVMDLNSEEIRRRLDSTSKAPPNQPAILLENLTIEQVAAIEAHALSYPAISVRTVQRRNYRYETMAAHVLGYMGEATREDLEKTPELAMGDMVGKKGVELTYESILRGHDGLRLAIVDSHGRILSDLPEGSSLATSGNNVLLTLDFELQRRAEQYFHDNELVGGAVALDPRNGEILALVSSPAFNPNVYSRRLGRDVWKTILSNPFDVEVNRVTQGLYSPGSVFKVVMAMAGLESGAITPSTRFHCAGSQVFFGRRFRCWKREGHGDVDLRGALQMSCDVYFYNVGARLGIDSIADYAHTLTFGEVSKVDLLDEKPGLVPSKTWAKKRKDGTWYSSETISVAIGQGPLLVTPLQVANMMAAIANGGRVYRPHLLREIEEIGANDEPRRKIVAPEVLHEVHLAPDALDAVRDGLWRAVNETRGTGRLASVPGLDVAGKTGTVQVITQKEWTKTENLPYRYRDHAWFASFAPRDDPQLVVVVFVEHGGHGGSDAAPLAAILYRSWFGRHTGPGATTKTASGEGVSLTGGEAAIEARP